ncbi:hypothetical protein OCF62_07315 [Bacillus wiedmannii]|uniref:hypothetical protein n=1 Tax=Bacillus wiedmannii TaxID=1890302 RepID=UPI0021D16D1B|nr:hypothetical protein [Bacillus wiedmannii]MCU5095004.1 hypothetical protein [Bacillus wiedmannii]MCU5514378.1 hypothetical protein [Bacillus wiedmannii]
MRKSLVVQTSEQKWFNEFRKSDEFAKALAFVWRNGHESSGSFIFSDNSYELVYEFSTLINGVVRSTEEKERNTAEWYCSVGLKHPFIQEIIKMGWESGSRYEREYPRGEFNDSAFIKAYIGYRHDLNRKKSKGRRGPYFSARLRIYGSEPILRRINEHLHEQLGVNIKTIQLERKKTNLKTINYQSLEEVPLILTYVGAAASLEKYYSFELGYENE